MTLDTMFDQARKGGLDGSMRAIRITQGHEIDVIEAAVPGIGP